MCIQEHCVATCVIRGAQAVGRGQPIGALGGRPVVSETPLDSYWQGGMTIKDQTDIGPSCFVGRYGWFREDETNPGVRFRDVDRRRTRRFPIREDLSYSFGKDKLRFTGSGRTIDMSRGGILFET